MVACGDMTDLPCEAVHSGVASLQSSHIVCLLAELNGLKLACGDVGNAHIKSCTSKKVFVCAGLQFGPLEGHSLATLKASWTSQFGHKIPHQLC